MATLTANLPKTPTLLTNALLGVGQILLWGGSFFMLAVLAAPIARDTHWPLSWLYSMLSVGLLVAGLLAPWVGRRLARPGGVALVRYSGVVMGLGLLGAAGAPALWLFGLSWVVIGVGMALGLYDALYAVLGKQYGQQAKAAIVQITLVSGFCTTVVWPLLAWGVAQLGWRGTCAGYGLLLLVVIWPLHRLLLPTDARETQTATAAAATTAAPAAAPAPGKLVFWLLAAHFMLGAVITAAMSVQLLDMLRAQGITTTAAVGLGALIGPSTVAVRVLDMLGPARSSSLTALLSAFLLVVGLALLGWLPQVAVVGIVCYGLGNGMRSILRGTLPLEVFGPGSYPVVMGQLARPVLIAQALTPLACGLLATHYNALAVLGAVGALAVANVGVCLALRLHLAPRAAVQQKEIMAA